MAGEIPPSGPKPSAKVFQCLSCGAPITLRALGQCTVVACESCGSVIDTANENYQIISQSNRKVKVKPLIPLGTRGKLRGILWEVIGFMQRTDGSKTFHWSEYLLFNPYKGFRWLTEGDGHWNYIATTKERPVMSDNEAIHWGKHYKLFERGRAIVIYVLGEFYWRVKVGDTVQVKDYVHPPDILSLEADAGEETWSVGEYIEPEAVRKAFNIQSAFPLRQGVAPNQPGPAQNMGEGAKSTFYLFLALLVFIQIATLKCSRDVEVLSEDFVYGGGDLSKPKTTQKFDLVGRGNVEIESVAEIDNSWIVLNYTLTNESTGATFEASREVSYYHGYDSDGSWSEGGHKDDAIFSSVPAGKYSLQIEMEGGGGYSSIPFQVTVRRDVPLWSNFFIALLLISIGPVIGWIVRRLYEQQRWANSDFNPYPKIFSSDDD